MSAVFCLATSAVALLALILPAQAEDGGVDGAGAPPASGAIAPLLATPAAPAPLGVFGASIPAPGKVVLSISPSFIRSLNSKIGTTTVSPQFIVATTPWFFDPAKAVRLVPASVMTAIQSVSLNHGLADGVALVFTAGAVQRQLDALTFAGASGVRLLGESTSQTAGLADFAAAGVFRLYQDGVHRFLVSFGLSAPTGTNHATLTLLQPDGSYGTARAFYAMQPGTGTWDAMPGVAYLGQIGALSWGLAYRGRLPVAFNPEHYRWGNLHEIHGWLGYTPIPEFTATCRLTRSTRGPIEGFDPDIRGKSQSSNPNYYGGQRIELFLGATLAGGIVGFEAASLAVEAGRPIYQELNGPQFARSWLAIIALRLKI